jgi:transcriptional regulator with XRE-family HTH domain
MTKSMGRAVWRRRLAAELRSLREDADLSLEAAAQLTAVHRSSLIAIETGQRRPQRRTVLSLLEKYGASEGQRDKLLALLDAPTEPAWMRSLRGRLPDAYEAYMYFESEAQEIKWYGTLPMGLLQTERYTRAHARGSLPDATKEEIDARVIARMKRQAAFTGRTTPLWVVMTEAAIRYQVGGPDVMREQLAHLLKAAEAPNITIQVIPFSVGAHPSMTASFRILDFAEREPPVVCQETAGGDLFLETPDDITAYRRVYAQLQAIALLPAESHRLITQALTETERMEAHRNGPRTALAQE